MKIKKAYNLKFISLVIAITFCLNTAVYSIDLSENHSLRIPMQMSTEEGETRITVELTEERRNLIFKSLSDWFFESAKEVINSGKRIEAVYLLDKARGSYQMTLSDRYNPYFYPEEFRILSRQLREFVAQMIYEIEKHGSLEECLEIISLSINTLRTEFNFDTDTVFKKMERRILEIANPKKIKIDEDTDEPVLKEGDVILDTREGKIYRYIGVKGSTRAQAGAGLPINTYVNLGTGFYFHIGDTYITPESFVDEVKSGNYKFLTSEKEYKTVHPDFVNDVIEVYLRLWGDVIGNEASVLKGREFATLKRIIPSLQEWEKDSQTQENKLSSRALSGARVSLQRVKRIFTRDSI